MIDFQEIKKLFDAKQYETAIQKLNEAWNAISDKTQQIEEQCDIQWWLGRCYLEQAQKTDDKQKADEYFEQARWHFQQQLDLAEELEKMYAQYWLGRCYFEQAKKTDDKQKADEYFEQARSHFQQAFDFAEKLENKQEQINAQFGLGRCYFEQAKKTDDKQKADKYFKQARSHFQKRFDLAEKLENEQEQINAQHWLGYCYFEQANKTDDKQKADKYFEQARLHFQKKFDLAEKLENEQEQINAQSWLGGCYLEQAKKTDDKQKADEYFEQARLYFQKQLDLTEKFKNDPEQSNAQFGLGYCYLEQANKTDDKQKADEHFEQARSHFKKRFDLAKKFNDEQGQIYAQRWLGRCYFRQEKYNDYFGTKKKIIEIKLPNLNNEIAQILAVLSIDPIEAHNRPFAHYTSPVVCEKLLGINQHPDKDKQPYENPSPMRMTSATYMNDPDEGKSLLDFLGKKELLLENKTPCREINAFFTCFSARVNDLNQFRLYGKVDGMEASGCCLVFNKKGEWVKESDVSRSFEGFKPNANEPKMSETSNQDLPLYQVAYLAYKDDYYQKGEYDYDVDVDVNGKFAVRLKPIMIENPIWHKVRVEKLKEGLNKLRDELEKNPNLDTKDLEYIRYLFKDYAFRDEEEFRLLRMKESGSDELKYCPVTNSVYLEYSNVGNMVDEVILGTNYEKSSGKNKTEVFRHLLKRKHPRIAVSRSTLPIN